MLNSSIFLTARIFRDKLDVRGFSLKILPYRGLIGKYFGFLGLSTAQAYACVKIFLDISSLALHRRQGEVVAAGGQAAERNYKNRIKKNFYLLLTIPGFRNRLLKAPDKKNFYLNSSRKKRR